MKSILGLLLLLQSVKMTEDFLPLEAGNRWVYDLTTETGQKIGQLDFVVSERTIVSGRSVYKVSGFPMAGESGSPTLIGYDRDSRQFIKMQNGQEIPLLTGDAESTQVLQSDSSGIPQKFSFRSESSTVVFQRGVGIVEARFATPDGIRIAKIVSSNIGRVNSSTPLSPPAAPALPAAVASDPAAANNPERTAPANVTSVTADNPVLAISAESTANGFKFELLVVNKTDKLLPFKFNSSKSYDFVIEDPVTGLEVWRWSQSMMFSQSIRTDSIRGDSKWTFTENWNRRDNNYNPVPAGKYRVTGILTSQPPIESKPIEIEVR
jgi:hypothetical protein